MAEYVEREAVIDLITRRYENPEICKKLQEFIVE